MPFILTRLNLDGHCKAFRRSSKTQFVLSLSSVIMINYYALFKEVDNKAEFEKQTS